MNDEAPRTARDVLRRTSEIVRSRLPVGWQVDVNGDEGNARDQGPDLIITATSPDRASARLMFEATTLVERRDVPRLIDQLRAYATPDAVPVLAARYLSRAVRDDLEAAGVSYVDATGNLRVLAASPAIYLADRGADRDPWRGTGRPRGTLKGEPAARVVRALLDYRRAWKVRDLIDTSGASTGATYRVLDYLQREGLAEKQDDRFVVPDWQRLLRAWSGDESFLAVSRIARFLEPRGLEAFELKASELKTRDNAQLRTAFTGSVAARAWAPYAPVKAAYVYVSSIEEATDAWQLRPNETAPNVILLEPNYPRPPVFSRTTTASDGLVVAAPAQVAADLLNSPGRGPSEGEVLLEWMTQNETAWRRD